MTQLSKMICFDWFTVLRAMTQNIASPYALEIISSPAYISERGVSFYTVCRALTGCGHRVISPFGNIVEPSLHFRVMTPWGTNDFWKKISKYRFIDFWGFLIGTIFKNQKMDQPSIPFESALNSASNDTLLVPEVEVSFFGGVVFVPS